MQRRHFLGTAAMAQAAQGQGQVQLPPANEFVASGTAAVSYKVDITKEGKRSGKPHKGRILRKFEQRLSKKKVIGCYGSNNVDDITIQKLGALTACIFR